MGSTAVRSIAAGDGRPPTIYESFDRRLPSLRKGDVAYTRVQSSGTLTAAAEPCHIFLKRPVLEYEREADRAREEAKRRRSLSLGLPIAERMDSYLLTSEGDVIVASVMYILHPINVVLLSLFPNLVAHVQEYTPKPQDLSRQGIESLGYDSEATSKVRFDLCWRTKRTNKTIAIIEFKKPQQLSRGDFERAMLGSSATEREINRMIERSRNTSLLDANGRIFAKQVTAYSVLTDCPFAALFSWDTLVLFEFDQLNADHEGIGDTGRITWLEEGSQSSTRFRKALLGWLIKACEHAGLQVS